MSKLDAAIDLFKAQLNYFPDDEYSGSINVALRILEAAAKLDKGFLLGFVNGILDYGPRAFRWGGKGRVEMLLSFVESLPDEEKE